MFATLSPAPSMATGTTNVGLPDVEEFKNSELLKMEKELLGFYITSHPLTDHQSALERYTTSSTKEAPLCNEGTIVTIGGMISKVKKIVVKNGKSAGQQMAIITIEDLDGQIDGTIFSDKYAEIMAKFPEAIAAESIVFVKAKVDKKREIPGLLVDDVIPMSEATAKLSTAMVLKLDPARHTPETIKLLPSIILQNKGRLPLFMQVAHPENGNVTIRMSNDMAIKATDAAVSELDHILGSGSVQLVGDGTKRVKRIQQQQLFKEAEADQKEADENKRMSDEQAAMALDMEMEESAA